MITWGNWYWPWWLGASVGAFAAMEVFALLHRGTDNTLSNWVWHQLNATARESMSQWNAAHFLVFGVWLVVVVWLTWHLFFHWFALWRPHGARSASSPSPWRACSPRCSCCCCRHAATTSGCSAGRTTMGYGFEQERGDYRLVRAGRRLWKVERIWFGHWRTIALPSRFGVAWAFYCELTEWQAIATPAMRSDMRGNLPAVARTAMQKQTIPWARW